MRSCRGIKAALFEANNVESKKDLQFSGRHKTAVQYTTELFVWQIGDSLQILANLQSAEPEHDVKLGSKKSLQTCGLVQLSLASKCSFQESQQTAG